jgi:hypothetical protein
MTKLIQFNNRKTRIAKLLGESQSWPKVRKPPEGRGLFSVLVACLFFTTLSFQTASLLSSIAFIILLTYSLSTKCLQWSLARTATITTLIVMSTLSGCGPLLSGQPKELITFCSDKIGECSTGVSSSLVICGIQINEISIEAAQANGGLEEVVGVNHAEGFGLIAVKRITVFGG